MVMADTATDITMDNSLLRLLHLVSPTLPTGAFSYSQGLEWAVETGWVHDKASLEAWLLDLAQHSMAYVDIPILKRMYQAMENEDANELEQWCDTLLACRESSELQEEEQTRGRALATLLGNLDLTNTALPLSILKRSQLAGYVLAARQWHIDVVDAALGYVWAWLENQVITGIKIVPLGQTQGQQLLMELSPKIPGIVTHGLQLGDHDIGAASPALVLACSMHESQYTRLYRS
jgi:urease accessory protein